MDLHPYDIVRHDTTHHDNIDIQQCKNIVSHLAILKNFHYHNIHEREWFSTHLKPKSLCFNKKPCLKNNHLSFIQKGK